jgi:hypothetical protein
LDLVLAGITRFVALRIGRWTVRRTVLFDFACCSGFGDRRLAEFASNGPKGCGMFFSGLLLGVLRSPAN